MVGFVPGMVERLVVQVLVVQASCARSLWWTDLWCCYDSVGTRSCLPECLAAWQAALSGRPRNTSWPWHSLFLSS